MSERRRHESVVTRNSRGESYAWARAVTGAYSSCASSDSFSRSVRVTVGVAAQNKAGLKGTSRRTMTLYLVLDATQPTVGIGVGALSYNGVPLAISVTCPGGQTYCDGSVAITATGAGHKAMVLGKSHFHIARDTTAAVTVVLSRTALAKLGERSAVTVSIAASATDQARYKSTAIRTTTLRVNPTGT